MEAIEQIAPGQFNCSTNYAILRPHLECNRKVECDGGEDETFDCPFTSQHCPADAFYQKVICIVIRLYRFKTDMILEPNKSKNMIVTSLSKKNITVEGG